MKQSLASLKYLLSSYTSIRAFAHTMSISAFSEMNRDSHVAMPEFFFHVEMTWVLMCLGQNYTNIFLYLSNRCE